MLLRRVAFALVATGVLIATVGVTAAATGERGFAGRQTAPGGELDGEGASFPCGYIEHAIEDAAEGRSRGHVPLRRLGERDSGVRPRHGRLRRHRCALQPGRRSAAAAKGMGYLQFAYVGGGIVIAYNPGSGLPYNLKLSADTIGKIFSGRIVNWDDPELADENPGVSLPDLSLRVAARSDSSGTTNGFTSFMAQTSTSWTAGARDVFDSPPLPAFPGLVTVEGSDGVADAVRDNPGMIGYVELSFARERRLNVAAVEGADGFVLPDTSAVTEAVASLRPNGDGTVTPSFATTPGYPLSVVTYLLLRQDNEDRQAAVNVRAFARCCCRTAGKPRRSPTRRSPRASSPTPGVRSRPSAREAAWWPRRRRWRLSPWRRSDASAARGRDPGDDGTHDACDRLAVRWLIWLGLRAHRPRSRPHSAQP